MGALQVSTAPPFPTVCHLRGFESRALKINSDVPSVGSGRCKLIMERREAGSKKLVFSLKKRAPEAGPQDSEAKIKQQRLASGPLSCSTGANGRSQPSPVLAHALGFDVPGGIPERPKAQLLLSIAGGQLEVEGGVDHAAPRVIPCRNPLPLSNYRVRITSSQRSCLDSSEPLESDAAAMSRNMSSGETDVGRDASAWGLQEVKRVTRDCTGSRFPHSKIVSAAGKTELGEGPSSSQVGDGVTTKLKADSPCHDLVTDEEAAASLLADARGEHTSYRVVPLLARNSALAQVRQKYRGEVERNQRHQQQAGEPDKLLLQRELELLPDAPLPSSSAYESMPVEEFGAAMLRGMGLKSVPSASPLVKRKAYTRAGLGSEREIDRLRERLEQQGRREDAAKRTTTAFIPLKTGQPAKD